MLATPLSSLRGAVTLMLMVVNVVLWFLPIFVFAVLKLALPIDVWRRWVSQVLVACAENWISVNNAILAATSNIHWDIRGFGELRRREWYLVVSNHQTWVDVLVLQKVFSRRVPFFKFFLKRQLIWVPFLGIAWWALDMPFMQRFSKSYLAKHPEKRGMDVQATRVACEKFREIPTSVISFVESTRSTPAKIRDRGSPYRYLLRPRSGGIAFALGAIGGMLRALIDVTIVYPQADHRFWDLCCGRIRRIVVDFRILDLPQWLSEGDYSGDTAFRQRFHQWIGAIWAEKDARIDAIRTELNAPLSLTGNNA